MLHFFLFSYRFGSKTAEPSAGNKPKLPTRKSQPPLTAPATTAVTTTTATAMAAVVKTAETQAHHLQKRK